MTPFILSLVMQYSAYYGLDPNIVKAVIMTESSFEITATGGQGEIGLMQLMPRYFKQVPKAALFTPAINIQLGTRHLKDSKLGCKHRKNFLWVVCYNRGVRGGSRLKWPQKTDYYNKVMKFYKRFKAEEANGRPGIDKRANRRYRTRVHSSSRQRNKKRSKGKVARASKDSKGREGANKNLH